MVMVMNPLVMSPVIVLVMVPPMLIIPLIIVVMMALGTEVAMIIMVIMTMEMVAISLVMGVATFSEKMLMQLMRMVAVMMISTVLAKNPSKKVTQRTQERSVNQDHCQVNALKNLDMVDIATEAVPRQMMKTK